MIAAAHFQGIVEGRLSRARSKGISIRSLLRLLNVLSLWIRDSHAAPCLKHRLLENKWPAQSRDSSSDIFPCPSKKPRTFGHYCYRQHNMRPSIPVGDGTAMIEITKDTGGHLTGIE